MEGMEQKTVIEITDPNSPPKVFIDGEEVKVISLKYNYETSTDYSHHMHDLDLLIPNVVDGAWGVKKIGFNDKWKMRD